MNKKYLIFFNTHLKTASSYLIYIKIANEEVHNILLLIHRQTGQILFIIANE